MSKFLITKFVNFINENNILNNNFYKWFNGSKLVDNENKPLIVYHGSNFVFDNFDSNKKRNGWLSKGFYFTENEEEANHYGNIIYPVYLRIINPFIIKGDIVNKDGTVEFAKSTKEQLFDIYPELKYIDFKDVSDFLKSKNYDGIINGNNLITVFDSNQIKSIENDGSWDLNCENIYS